MSTFPITSCLLKPGAVVHTITGGEYTLLWFDAEDGKWLVAEDTKMYSEAQMAFVKYVRPDWNLDQWIQFLSLNDGFKEAFPGASCYPHMDEAGEYRTELTEALAMELHAGNYEWAGIEKAVKYALQDQEGYYRVKAERLREELRNQYAEMDYNLNRQKI